MPSRAARSPRWHASVTLVSPSSAASTRGDGTTKGKQALKDNIRRHQRHQSPNRRRSKHLITASDHQHPARPLIEGSSLPRSSSYLSRQTEHIAHRSRQPFPSITYLLSCGMGFSSNKITMLDPPLMGASWIATPYRPRKHYAYRREKMPHFECAASQRHKEIGSPSGQLPCPCSTYSFRRLRAALSAAS